jgi:peptidoglycan/LPS O-acetylase OafA/YrhL
LKATSGEHYIALDHVRAFAACLVFCWHFLHNTRANPIAAGYDAPFPLSIFNEGHTGVALFMALSGYLFAKLLADREVRYGAFFWNRFLRLAPLIVVVLSVVAIRLLHLGTDPLAYYADALFHRVLWPNGLWSIECEIYFYLLLPALLWLDRRSAMALPAALLFAIALRAAEWSATGSVQDAAYWTLFGRIDQFLLGIMAYRHRALFANRPLVAAAIAVAFLAFYAWFDRAGGFNGTVYPSPSRLWIFLPTIEGLSYAALIAWYDQSFRPRDAGVSRVIARFGTYSYSIYVFHFFVVFWLARQIDAHVVPLGQFLVALPIALLAFGLMLPIGYLSYRFIETPFLKHRRKYLRERQPVQPEVIG